MRIISTGVDLEVEEAVSILRNMGYEIKAPERVVLEVPGSFMGQVFFGKDWRSANKIEASETHLATVDRLCQLVLDEKESREVRHTLASYIFGIQKTSHEFYRALGQYRKWYRDAPSGTYKVSTY